MARRQSSPAYGQDLAYIHEVGFGAFAKGAAPGLLKGLRAAGIRDGLVVDLGCGSGIWARRLVDAGYDVIGVDISPAMVELARRRAPEAKFHVGSFLDFELPQCRAITALGEVVCFQFDGRNNRAALLRFFRRAHAALSPAGVLVFDVAEVGLDRARPPMFREEADWSCAVRFEYEERREQLVRHIVTFRKVGDTYRRHEEMHRLQLYRRSEIAGLLRRAGFGVRTVRRYGGYALPPGRVGFIARR